MKIKNAMISLFMVLILCFSAVSGLAVVDTSDCDFAEEYEENDEFTFNGVLMEVRDIDMADGRIDLKFLESGIIHVMDAGDYIERDGISVELVDIDGAAGTSNDRATLCMKVVETPEPEPQTCEDSDEVDYLDIGQNLYVKGKVVTRDETVYDYCYDSDTVVEVTCDEAGGKAYKYDCPNGCVSGKCYYPGYYLEFDKDKYYPGDVIEFKIRAADSETANIHLYIMPYDTDEKILVKPNLLVQGTTTVEIDTTRYSNIFDSTDNYLFLVTDATTDGVGGGIGTNSAQTSFVKSTVDEEEPVEVPVCRDSDGGRNEFVRGTTTGTTACTVQENCNNLVSSTDSCNGDTLNEYVCDIDPRYNVKRRYVNFIQCENGCSNGACIAEEEEEIGQHQIASISGTGNRYASKESISLKVKALEGDGSTASSSEGWNVQYYTYLVSNPYNYMQEYTKTGKYNAVFDGDYWNIDYSAPEDKGNYYTEIILYCSRDGSKCMEEVGHAPEDEVRRKVYFNVGEGLAASEMPDLVIKNLQFVKKGDDLSTIEFDIYNAGDAATESKFAIAVYVDSRIQTHTVWYDPIAPGEKIHKELSNYNWLSSATFSRAVTIVADRFVGSEEDNPIYEGFFDNMVSESNDYNNKAELTVGGTEEVPIYNKYTLADYPDLFISHGRFNGYIVVGDRAPASDVVAAVDIATGIQFSAEGTPSSTIINKIEVGAAKLASEIVNPMKMRIISVGNACNNAVTDELKGHPEPCRKGLGQDLGVIRLYQYNGMPQIVVDGYSEVDVRKAAKVLANYNDYDLKGTCMLVGGDFNNPKVKPCSGTVYEVPEEAVEEEQVPYVVVIPDSNGDCDAGSCPVENTCVALGIRLVDDETPSYCDFDGRLKGQKEDDELCQNDYECLSNSCGNGKCQDFGERLNILEREMRETQGMLNRLVSWIRNWFGGGVDDDAGDDNSNDDSTGDADSGHGNDDGFDEDNPGNSGGSNAGGNGNGNQGNGGSSVIENDFGVLTYESTSVSNFCDFVHDVSCSLYTAEYKYNGKSARIVAGVEVHPASFTNQQAIEGIMGEFGREGYTSQKETYEGNNIYLFTGGSYPDQQMLAAWSSGKNVVALYVDNSPAVLTDAEVDDVFEDSLVKYYLAMYPSDLEFE